MARQKTVQEPKKKKARNDMIVDAPKCGKQRRSNKQIERVKKDGTKIAGIVGMIITLSSIKWKVSSQTLRDVW